MHGATMKIGSISFLTIKSRNALLHMVMVCFPKLSTISSETYILNFACHWHAKFKIYFSGHYIFVRKDLRIRGYFSTTQGVSEQNVWEILITEECVLSTRLHVVSQRRLLCSCYLCSR